MKAMRGRAEGDEESEREEGLQGKGEDQARPDTHHQRQIKPQSSNPTQPKRDPDAISTTEGGDITRKKKLHKKQVHLVGVSRLYTWNKYSFHSQATQGSIPLTIDKIRRYTCNKYTSLCQIQHLAASNYVAYRMSRDGYGAMEACIDARK